MQPLRDAEPEELGAQIGQPPLRSPNFFHLPSHQESEIITSRTQSGIAPGNVEIGGAALLALSRSARGADSTKGKQRHEESYHTIDRFASDRNGGCGQSLGRGFGQL